MAMNKKNANYVTEKNDMALAQRKKTKRNQKIKEVTKQVIYVVLAVVLATVLITGIFHTFKACTKVDEREFLDPSKFEVTDTIELTFEGYEPIRLQLFGKEAPKTVANFKKMVEDGIYASKFMSVNKTDEYVGFSHSDEKNAEDEHDHEDEGILKGEFYDNDVVNRISHVEGVLTMQRNYYSSSSVDFMVMTSDKHAYKNGTNKDNNYDGLYAAFGRVHPDDMAKLQKMVEDYNGDTDKNNTVSELKNGTNKPTDKDLEAGFIDRVFTPDYTGKYTFESSANFTEIAFDGATAEKLGTVEKELVAGTEYKIRLTIKDDAKIDGTFTVTIKDTILEEDTSNGITIVEKDKTDKKVFNYTFETPVAGEYVFTYDKIKDVVIKDKDGNEVIGTGAKANASTVTYNLDKATYYVEIPAVGAEFANNSKSVTVKISIEGKYFVIGENKDITFTQEQIDAKTVIYTFYTGVQGQYNFSGTVIDKGLEITDFDGNKLNIKLPSTNDADPDYDSKSAILEAGKSYKLVIKTEGLKKDTKYTLKIDEPAIKVGTNTVTVVDADVSKNASGVLSYTFVAENSGKHVFSIDTKDAKNIRIYEGDKEIGNPYAYLEAGKSYTVKVEIKGNSNFKKDTKCIITVDDSVISLNTNTSTDETKDTIKRVEITEKDKAQEKLEYTFTATATCAYEFLINSDLKDKDIKDFVELYVNDKKVESYEYVNLNKDDVCKLVINTKTMEIPTSTDKDVESCVKVSIMVEKSTPKIASIKIVK